jgi:ParB-like chromosome segregation protein Spo0J
VSPIKDWLGNVTADGDMVSVTVGLPDDPIPIEQDYEMVPVDRLSTHPENARRGNTEVIRESIRTNGFYGACVVQRSTGRILVGNHRYLAAVEEGLAEVPVVWVDKSDEEARRLLLVDNRSTDLASYDYTVLLRLLDEQKEETSLLGTGWDDEDLVRLLAKIDPEPPEGWATFDEDSLLTDHQCPKCGYEWS